MLTNDEIRTFLINFFESKDISEDNLLDILPFIESNSSAVRDIFLIYLPQIDDNLKYFVANNLTQYLESKDLNLRNNVAQILVLLKDHSLESLYNSLNDDNDKNKLIIDTVGLIGNKESINKIFKYLDHPDDNIKIAVIDAISIMKVSDHLDYLIEIFNKNQNLRLNIIECISKIEGNKSEDFLFDVIINSSDNVEKILAIDGICEISKNVKIANLLLEQIEFANEEVSLILFKSAVAIYYRNNQYLQNKSKYYYLIPKCLKSDDENIKLSGLISLGENYNINEVGFLLDYIYQGNDDTIRMIFSNLSNDYKEEIINLVLKEICLNCGSESILKILFILKHDLFKNYNKNEVKIYEKMIAELKNVREEILNLI